MEEKEELYKSLKENAHHSCPDNDLWQQYRGGMFALEGIISFEGTTKWIYESNLAEEKSDREEDIDV